MNAPHILAAGYLERRFAHLRSDIDDRVRVANPIMLPNDRQPETDLAVLCPGAPAKPNMHDVLLVIEISHATRRRGARSSRTTCATASPSCGSSTWSNAACGSTATAVSSPARCWAPGGQLVADGVPEVSIDLDELLCAAGV